MPPDARREGARCSPARIKTVGVQAWSKLSKDVLATCDVRPSFSVMRTISGTKMNGPIGSVGVTSHSERSDLHTNVHTAAG